MTSNAAAQWYETFFSGPVVETWLRTPTADQTRQEADFIEAATEVSPGARSLDVPCGGGRHSLELARRGYHLTGVDISADFLEFARSQRPEGSGSVTWHHRDIRDPPTGDGFDAAFSLGNSFGYLDAGDCLMLASRRYDPAASRLHVESTFIRDGVVDRRTTSMSVYGCRELFRMFQKAGFGRIEGFGSLGREPFRLGSSRLVVVATTKSPD